LWIDTQQDRLMTLKENSWKPSWLGDTSPQSESTGTMDFMIWQLNNSLVHTLVLLTYKHWNWKTWPFDNEYWTLFETLC
jgi:hypothetical protein